MFSSLIDVTSILIANARCIILETGFKNSDFTFNWKIPHSQKFENIFNLNNVFYKIFFACNLFVIRKRYSKKFIESEVTVFIPQSAIFSPFSTPLPATSHFDLLGLRPVKRENWSNTFIISITDNSSFGKNVE